MAYERNLANVTRQILALPDVAGGVEDPSNGLTPDFIVTRVENNADEIFQAAASHIDSFEGLQKGIAADRDTFAKQTAEPGDVTIFGGIAAIALLALIVGGPIALIGAGPAQVWSWLVSVLSTQAGMITAIVIVLFAGTAGFRLYRYHMYIAPAREHMLRNELELDSADERLAAKKKAADDAVHQEVLRNVLGIIADATRSFYQNRLFVPETPGQSVPAPYKATTGHGLSEVVNSSNEVPTAVYHDLLETFENLPGASIGVCGPRGAGKSTLLWSLCGANRKVAGKEAIAVYTSAPVEYETRDFLLHIFSCVCRQILKTKGVAEDRSITFDDGNADGLVAPVLRQQSRIGWLLIWLGGAFSILGLILAASIYEAAVTTLGNKPAKSFIEVLELKPGPLVLWGVVAATFGAVLVLWEKVARIREQLARRSSPSVLRKLLLRRLPPTQHVDPLARKAQEHLREIRFQRSYSTGWSGALKIPAGFETGATLGSSFAQKQESLPELVDRFRNFAELITRDYRLIIGIDELDKLKSETDAQRFINEIKAIFNIPGCFYLMSVSENAISSFERRGMPFRDEFDSAFDDIRYIGYFTLAGSRHLLGRRVLNLPEPFLCLCHVLSAGLPRDLIRVTRGMLDYVKIHADASNTIQEVATTLIQKEVAKKVRAIEIAAREIPLEPETTEFLQQVTRLQDFDPRLADSNGQWIEQTQTRTDLTADEKVNLTKLSELRRELNTFLYFSATAAELFAQCEGEAAWKSVIRAGHLERLAEARQAFELNPGVVAYRLTEFRKQCNLPPIARWTTMAEQRTSSVEPAQI
jgi:energy-coupling factor transporter ATP-binding protein EcfA2